MISKHCGPAITACVTPLILRFFTYCNFLCLSLCKMHSSSGEYSQRPKCQQVLARLHFPLRYWQSYASNAQYGIASLFVMLFGKTVIS